MKLRKLLFAGLLVAFVAFAFTGCAMLFGKDDTPTTTTTTTTTLPPVAAGVFSPYGHGETLDATKLAVSAGVLETIGEADIGVALNYINQGGNPEGEQYNDNVGAGPKGQGLYHSQYFGPAGADEIDEADKVVLFNADVVAGFPEGVILDGEWFKAWMKLWALKDGNSYGWQYAGVPKPDATPAAITLGTYDGLAITTHMGWLFQKEGETKVVFVPVNTGKLDGVPVEGGVAEAMVDAYIDWALYSYDYESHDEPLWFGDTATFVGDNNWIGKQQIFAHMVDGVDGFIVSAADGSDAAVMPKYIFDEFVNEGIYNTYIAAGNPTRNSNGKWIQALKSKADGTMDKQISWVPGSAAVLEAYDVPYTEATILYSSYNGGDDVNGPINNGDWAWAGWGYGQLNDLSVSVANEKGYQADGTTEVSVSVWGNLRPSNSWSTREYRSSTDIVNDNPLYDDFIEEYAGYDFTLAKLFNTVTLYPRNDGVSAGWNFPQGYVLQSSDDGEVWDNILTVTAPATPLVPTAPVVHSFTAVTARYFRVLITDMINNEGGGEHYKAQLAELAVEYVAE
jgi:hypothetical protein